MSVNLLTIVLWSVFYLMLANLPQEHIASDTLKITSRGSNNSIVIDSVCLQPPVSDSIFTINGTITQDGVQNQVEINTGKSLAPGRTKSTITIKQSGKNNSVKINSK